MFWVVGFGRGLMEKGLSHRQEPGIWTTSYTEARISNVLRLVLILEYEWPFNEERIKGAKRVDLSNLVHKDVGQGRVGRIPPMRLLPMNRWWYLQGELLCSRRRFGRHGSQEARVTETTKKHERSVKHKNK